jgi:hypothetical protein
MTLAPHTSAGENLRLQSKSGFKTEILPGTEPPGAVSLLTVAQNDIL